MPGHGAAAGFTHNFESLGVEPSAVASLFSFRDPASVPSQPSIAPSPAAEEAQPTPIERQALLTEKEIRIQILADANAKRKAAKKRRQLQEAIAAGPVVRERNVWMQQLQAMVRSYD